MKRASILWACLALGCAVGGGRDPDGAAPDTDGGTVDVCTAPSLVCGGECVDPATNRRHCGGCDLPCAGECSDGQCPMVDCRTSELGCPTGTSCDPTLGECVTVECDPGLVACGSECCEPPLFGSPEDLALEGRSINLALAPSDEPTIALTSTGPAPLDVTIRRRVNGMWQSSTVTSVADGATVSLALDASGAAHVVWAEPTVMGFSHSVDGGAAERFGDTPVVAPRVRIPGGTRPVVGFAAGSPGELRLAERAAIWVSEGAAERAEVDGVHTALAIGLGSEPHFGFVRQGEVRYGVRVAGTWSDEPVYAGGMDTATSPAIAVDASDAPHLLYWREPSSGEAQLWHASRAMDGTWYREIVDSSSGESRDAAIVAGADGTIHVAYFDGTRVLHGVSSGRGFAPTVIATVSGGREVELALDSSGAPYVLYSDGLDALSLAGPP